MEKTKLSLKKSIKYIFSSKYLLCIAIMVIGYGLAMSTIEVSWKAALKMAYPNPIDYQSYMGTTTFFVGLVSFLVALLVGGGFIRFFGWRFSAQIPPFVVCGTGLVFFVLLMLHKILPSTFMIMGVTPLILIVTFGALQNVLSKTVKYSLFDPTKEMAYIPLDHEAQVKGKAAIDVIGSRLGKSGASWIQIGLIDLIGSGSVLMITPYLIPIVFFTMISWIISVHSLNRQFSLKQEEKYI